MTSEFFVAMFASGLLLAALFAERKARKTEERAVGYLREATDAYALAVREREEARRWLETALAGAPPQTSTEGTPT